MSDWRSEVCSSDLAPAPGCNSRAVLGAGRIGIGLVLAARRRAVDPDASLGRPFGIVVLVKAAVDQMAPGPAAVALLQALKHRPHQAAVGAAGQRRDIDHDLALRHGGDLTVVGGAETAVDHLHDARLRIAGRGTRLFLLGDLDRKSTRLNSSHYSAARMPSSA